MVGIEGVPTWMQPVGTSVHLRLQSEWKYLSSAAQRDQIGGWLLGVGSWLVCLVYEQQTNSRRLLYRPNHV